MNLETAFRNAEQSVHSTLTLDIEGKLLEIRGPIMIAGFPGAKKGMICELQQSGRSLKAEVIAMQGDRATLTPFGDTSGFSVGARLKRVSKSMQMRVSDAVLGRVINVFGEAIDGGETLPKIGTDLPIRGRYVNPMSRPVISRQMQTSIRAIDGFATLGWGQRMGVFGAPGTGKSSLVEMLVQSCEADVVVVALVGERGREVREFFENIAENNMHNRLLIVAATSDRPAIERSLCAHSASTVAEYFRDQGKSVFLVVDSLTRTARALREIGLAAGEVPARRGYPASVYPTLPAIIERAGRGKKGDITAVYTILTEGNIETDPIGEEVKSLTDGHIVLSRELANAGHYPAIDVVSSISRSMKALVSEKHIRATAHLRKLLVSYQEAELLLKVGEYQSGNDAATDEAIEKHEAINLFLRQGMHKATSAEETQNQIARLAK